MLPVEQHAHAHHARPARRDRPLACSARTHDRGSLGNEERREGGREGGREPRLPSESASRRLLLIPPASGGASTAAFERLGPGARLGCSASLFQDSRAGGSLTRSKARHCGRDLCRVQVPGPPARIAKLPVTPTGGGRPGARRRGAAEARQISCGPARPDQGATFCARFRPMDRVCPSHVACPSHDTACPGHDACPGHGGSTRRNLRELEGRSASVSAGRPCALLRRCPWKRPRPCETRVPVRACACWGASVRVRLRECVWAPAGGRFRADE
jgi:hypothetical protein